MVAFFSSIATWLLLLLNSTTTSALSHPAPDAKSQNNVSAANNLNGLNYELEIQPLCPSEIKMGNQAAAIELALYYDPTASSNMNAWLRVLKLHGELKHQVAIVVRPVAATFHSPPAEQRVRNWGIIVTQQISMDVWLQTIENYGTAKLGNMLKVKKGREELAERIGLQEPAIHQWRQAPLFDCYIKQVQRSTNDWHAGLEQSKISRTQLPSFQIRSRTDPTAKVTTVHKFSDLRPSLDRSIQSNRFELPTRNASNVSPRDLPQPPRAQSFRSDAGILLGGIALPHQMIIAAFHNRDEVLGAVLPAMNFRSRFPGVLSVQVVALGNSPEATKFKRMLCAAKKLDMGLDLAALWIESQNGEDALRDQAKSLLEQTAQSSTCDGAAGIASTVTESDHPMDRESLSKLHGVWLDGLSLNRTSITHLDDVLSDMHQSTRILDVLLPRGNAQAQ